MGYYKAMWEKKLRDTLDKTSSQFPSGPHDRFAAVLMLIVPKYPENDFEILLTKRTEMVEKHKSQISLPGGFRETSDQSWLETALRETDEEIGVSSAAIEILGQLEPVQTKGAIEILPFVGILKQVPELKLNPQEVERVLFLPSKELLTHGLRPVVAQEGSFSISSVGIFWEEELIWGATARILEQLYYILKA